MIGISLALTPGNPVLRGPAFLPETEALVARFTTPPTALRKQQINTLIGALQTAGIWSKFDAFYVIAAADAQAAQRNWVQDLYNISPVSSPTFTADRGYAGNGTSSYLSTTFTPSSASSPKFVQNSAAMGFWSRTNIQSNCDMGARVNAAQDCTFFSRNFSNQALQRLNVASASGLTPANSDSTGLFTAVRSSSSALAAYRNNTSLGTGTPASTAVSTLPLYIGARNEAGVADNFTTRQYAAAFISSSLSGSEVTALYNALNTYMTAVGAA